MEEARSMRLSISRLIGQVVGWLIILFIILIVGILTPYYRVGIRCIG